VCVSTPKPELLEVKLQVEKFGPTRGGKLAKQLGVEWNLFKTWLFDPALIPRDKVKLLATSLGIREEELISQNWALALEQAELILKLRNDLAWPYVVIGGACERERQIPEAKDAYRAGLMKLSLSANGCSRGKISSKRTDSRPRSDGLRGCAETQNRGLP